MKSLLEDLAEAVQRAVDGLTGDPGEILGRGADGAPSTRIDREAEAAVLRTLDERGAELNVLSEEAGFVDRGGTATLVLDPVDGTHNALRGVPAYSVSIALGHERLSDVEEGLVRDLVSGATYHAARGKGATLDGRSLHVRAYSPNDTLFTVYLGTNADPDAAEVAAKARRVRNLGAASLDLCLVARGAADLYYMHSAVPQTKLRVVDLAAGTLIVREAGGHVLTLQGKDLDMPLTSEARTDLVAVGDLKTWEAIR
ncbi:MAG: inositol monophosphatase family protein [Candidatus Thermoplasmatota archaeon]